MSSVYLYSIFHAVFVLGLYFIWRLIDKNQDYKEYIKISLSVGIFSALFFDFIGVILFGFWGYFSHNPLEYISISLSTYIIATPLMIEVMDYLMFKFSIPKIEFRYHISRLLAMILLVFAATIGLIVTYLKLQSVIEADWGFFILLALMFMLCLDMLLLILKGTKGAFIRFIEGHIFAPLAIFISGLLCGFIWEVFNTYVPLWHYQNVPAEKVIGVPLVVVISWGMLVYGYWALSQLLFSNYRLRSH